MLKVNILIIVYATNFSQVEGNNEQEPYFTIQTVYFMNILYKLSANILITAPLKTCHL